MRSIRSDQRAVACYPVPIHVCLKLSCPPQRQAELNGVVRMPRHCSGDQRQPETATLPEHDPANASYLHDAPYGIIVGDSGSCVAAQGGRPFGIPWNLTQSATRYHAPGSWSSSGWPAPTISRGGDPDAAPTTAPMTFQQFRHKPGPANSIRCCSMSRKRPCKLRDIDLPDAAIR